MILRATRPTAGVLKYAADTATTATSRNWIASALLCGAMIAFAPSTASATVLFSEDFESYTNGQALDNVNGWAGWDNVSSAAGSVTNAEAHSGSQSIRIDGGTDAVHLFGGQFTTGYVRLDAWMLLRQNDHVGTTYFIVNNIYNHGGPYQWAINLWFEDTTGEVIDDEHFPKIPGTIKYDDWALISILFDLDNDYEETYYDGQLISTGKISENSPPDDIVALDLYSPGSISYFDDITVTSVPRPTNDTTRVPEPATSALFGLGLAALVMRRRRKA